MTVSGWEELDSYSRSDVGLVKIWQRIATSTGPSSYALNDPTAAPSTAIIVALTGYDPSQPLAITPTFAEGAASSTHPASSVTGVAGGLLLTTHVAGTAGTSRSYTGVPSGMTRAQETTLSSGGYILCGVFYQPLSAVGATGSKIATCSSSRPYITMSLVVREPSPQTVSPPAINSAEAFGSPAVSIAGSNQTVTAVSIGSGEAFGSPTVTVPTVAGLYPGSTVYPGADLFPGGDPPAAEDQTIIPAALASAEAFGTPIVAVADGSQTIAPTSIDS